MVAINYEQVQKIGELLKTKELGQPLNFYSYALPDGTVIVDDKKFPPLGHPAAIDFLFAVVMQDYGFWLGSNNGNAQEATENAVNGYVTPTYATAGSKRLKGSDFLWTVSVRMLKAEEGFFSPERLALAEHATMERWFADDMGRAPFPDLDTRLSLARFYGIDMTRSNRTPYGIVDEANGSAYPLKRFMQIMAWLPGYYGDRLHKKSLLLAMALANRPEHFLHIEPSDPSWEPIVDYHLMRLALRTGMVNPGEWLPYVEERCIKPMQPGEIKAPYIPEKGEQEIREKVFEAMQEIANISGKSPMQLDFPLWDARRYCPEMETPNCPACPFTGVCQKRTTLFQPVRRHTMF